MLDETFGKVEQARLVIDRDNCCKELAKTLHFASLFLCYLPVFWLVGILWVRLTPVEVVLAGKLK